jgi:hypothetical protein
LLSPRDIFRFCEYDFCWIWQMSKSI